MYTGMYLIITLWLLATLQRRKLHFLTLIFFGGGGGGGGGVKILLHN